MTLSPPRQMAMGMRLPSFFQLRQCEAPSWCMCQCMASDVDPSSWLRYMPMLWLAGFAASRSSAWMVCIPASVM